MRILFLTFYFSPDLSAGSFRSQALVEALANKLPAGAAVDVVTTLPNRYSSFASEASEMEESGQITIHRIPLPSHKSGMLDQSWAYLSYLRGAMRCTRGREYDLVFATSSRLMTASLGALLARRLRAPLYLDIRDIFVDTIGDVLSGMVARAMKPAFSALERWTLRSAQRINLVSPGFLDYFRERYPDRSFATFTNGIDKSFVDIAPESVSRSDHEPKRVVYAGNMGEGQGLHAIIPGLARRLEGRAHFQLIGDGGRRPELERALAEAGCGNVEVLDPVDRPTLIEYYRNSDVLFLHLNDYAAFRKVLPSKVFEYAALGKPVWAGVAGYSAGFIRENIDNAAVFPPCDVDAGLNAFDSLEFVTRSRQSFLARFARASIMSDMADDVLGLLPGTDTTR